MEGSTIMFGKLIEILKDGAQRADAIAQKTMARVKDHFGLGLGK